MTINNRERVVEQLAEYLKFFDKECNNYQTDVYMYVDENGNGELELFVNVGGNSWLDDDHYTVYSDKEHFDDYTDYYNDADPDYFAEVIGIPVEQLEQETRKYIGCDDDEKIDSEDVYEYLFRTGAYSDRLYAEYKSAIEEHSPEYMESAEEIFSIFEESQEEE